VAKKLGNFRAGLGMTLETAKYKNYNVELAKVIYFYNTPSYFVLFFLTFHCIFRSSLKTREKLRNFEGSNGSILRNFEGSKLR
jgi:hypothetical protein